VLAAVVPALPIASALLMLLVRTPRHADAIATVAAPVTAAVALTLAVTVLARGGAAPLHGRWYEIDGASGVFLAVIALLRAAWGHRVSDRVVPEPCAAAGGMLRSWGRGVMTNLLNPKIGAFYLAVLPQFIATHASHLAVGLLLAFVHDLEGIMWFTAIILGAHSVRGLLVRRSARRAVDGVTGATLIGFGLKLGLSSK
jgi:hypothetical protein